VGFLQDDYNAIIMIQQLLTIKLNTELHFIVDVDLLVFNSSLTVLRVCDVLADSKKFTTVPKSHFT